MCKIVLSQLLLFVGVFGYSQKAIVRLELVDGSMKDPSNYVFRVNVANRSFKEYLLQDTSYLKATVEWPDANLIVPFIWQKVNGVYKTYEHDKHHSGPLRPKCVDSCCGCIILKQKRSMSFDLNLLKCCILEKGKYRVQAGLHPPAHSCVACPELAELESNYVYFEVK